MADEIPFKKTPPKWRTIAAGIWTDILNDWSASFETSNRGTTALGVFIQDQTSQVLSVPFLKDKTPTTLAVDAAVNTRTLTLSPGHGAVVGDVLKLSEGLNFIQAEILVVAVNVITIDQPTSFAKVAGSPVVISTQNMLVDGSVTPEIFRVLPLPEQVVDVVSVILEIRGASGDIMDFSSFGSREELTNGCVLRINNGDNTFKNLFNFKSNSDFIGRGFDHAFLNAKTGNTIAGFTSRVTWGGQSKHGVVIRIDGNKGESLELIVQDNLLGVNTRFRLSTQGHEVQN